VITLILLNKLVFLSRKMEEEELESELVKFNELLMQAIIGKGKRFGKNYCIASPYFVSYNCN
jgi:hypothetical protein